MRRKFKAFVISAFWTVLPCVLAGGIVGAFFVAAFWHWFLGIAVLAFIYVCLDRIPVRLYGGALSKLPLGRLLKYGYASTEKRPLVTDYEIEERNRFNIYSYDHFYGDRDK